MNMAHNIAERLLDIQAVKLNPSHPFTWASGMRSPVYCDNRRALAHPDFRNQIATGLCDLVASIQDCGAIAGVATAGIAWGALLAHETGLPFCYVRSKPKDHGLKNRIEGQLEVGSRVVVVEDLISTGKSSLEACDALIEEGMDVLAVVSIFQYGFAQTKAQFEQRGLKFFSLCSFSELLERALQRKSITSTEFEELMSWNQDPAGWSQSFLAQKAGI
ncbi:MAG: Orotate phosphoribosyltransferase [Saprospiraceae bacterium]|jgi:orotate phosphoribosyltransferase|nr:Orotate phosphoribosyltransferase [Saprospiraceae bacterium]